ncbi:hypothetical protein L1887_15657 [Cichorium endivia]|nr:hypothetical protein L1887_15657 [Cichorium endivia]
MLKKKSEEIRQHLDGRCLYLVGMMGSGKTTSGQILSEILGYSFLDSDKVIEECEGISVANIFKLHGQNFFREKETEVLRKLSSMHGVVVSTGGGAVIQPINWKYMHKGITIFLDVPLQELARRIIAVGSASRPLLDHGSSDGYLKTLKQLSMLWKERSEAYTNAHVRVSLENIAPKLGHRDVCSLSKEENKGYDDSSCNDWEFVSLALIQIERYLTM